VATRLLAITGPLRKSEFSIEEELSIGRGALNALSLDDPSVSPEHCSIVLRDGRYILTDLESRSGTFVNGIPTRQRALESGDEVTIGSSVFLYIEKNSERTKRASVQLAESSGFAKTSVIPSEQLDNLQPESLAALPKLTRMARTLTALLQISRTISSLRDEESLPWQLLGLIFDVIPAERGAILLIEEDSREVRSEVAWDRVRGPEHQVPIAQEIVRRVLEEGIALRDDTVSPEQSSSGATPGEGNAPHPSILCVPMISNEKPIGIIYLESKSSTAILTQDDLELLTAIAALGVVGIESARHYEKLGSENQRLRAEVSLTHDMVGRSAKMREVFQFIERVAPRDSTVLICGESGTGKELAARAIHKNSTRKSQPFVALNCAALTETLLESELFGHEKGAFTSAISQKKGFLEVAEGGTIFLDEIGELSPILQAKLLRVLQEREFVRVGGTRPIKINVRFVAATNRDLQKDVREEKFRTDLFHRLNVISITLPSLREHPEDIPALAEHFAARHAKNCNRTLSGISHEAMDSLTQYDWPGNIRELENAMERAVVVGSTDRILAEDLPETVLDCAKPGAASTNNYHDAIRNLKKRLILESVEQSAGNITDAARLLGVHPNYLHRLMRNLGLRPVLKKQTGA
jgi:transcriptional regulator with GAF, ATPase, and Fis domain